MEISQWKERMEHVRILSRMIILEGNVSDMFIQENGLEAGRLVELDQYLYQYLKDAGYHAIVFFNRLDSFYNDYDETGEMLKLFYKEAKAETNNQKMDLMQAMSAIRTSMKNEEHSVAIVINMAGQLMSNPEHLNEQEIEYLTTLFLAAKEASEAPVASAQGWTSNLIIMVTNKVHELPTWFYRYAPFVRSIEIELPGEKLRKALFQTHGKYYQGWDLTSEDEKEKLMLRLVQKTEGMSCMELDGILTATEGMNVRSIEEQIYSYRHGKKENPWSEINGERVKKISEALSNEILGQEKAVASVKDVIFRATTGLTGIQHSSGTRPRGVMLFAGPTGVGKTEMAKVMAREIFGTEEAMLRFDMSEYSQSHSDQRLLGAPPGYVGYDAGGELTNAVKAKPFSILLFDEIEKANPTILDKFLQILDDGRMTDSRGETVYFTECLIIFTSNIGMNRARINEEEERVQEVSYDELDKKVKQALRENWRPEFINRIGQNVIVFDYIRETDAEAILRKQLTKICNLIAAQKNIRMNWTEDSMFYKKMKEYCMKTLQYGGRGIGNVVEHYFLTPLGRELVFESILPGERINLADITDDKISVNLVWDKIL